MPQVPPSVSELARSPELRGCLDWFRQERAWINELHLKLCRVPAPTFFEGPRAEWMAERFREAGWEARIDKAGNVIACLPGRKADPSIAVTAHLDTVLAPRNADDITVSTSDGRFLGPGVSDNGVGLTALIALAGAWKAAPPQFTGNGKLTPVLIANVGEEGEGNLSGMRFVCRAANATRPRAFLVLDGPNTDHITCRALASRRFEVIVSGPGGHSWSDHGAGNPVHAISRAITIFTDSVPTGDVPRSSFNFGLVRGGTSVNSIPSEARAKVDLRSEDPARIDQLAALLESSVERAIELENARGNVNRVAAKVKEIGSRPGGALAEGSTLLETIRLVDAFLGIRSSLDCSSTDANIPLSMGLPAISIGAGGQGGGAHTAAEWFHPEGREVGLRRVLLTLCMLLTDSGKELR